MPLGSIRHKNVSIDVQLYCGLTPGDNYEAVLQYGHSNDVDIGSATTVWDAEILHNFIPVAAASGIECVSDNTEDALASTGARTIEVCGLDLNFNEIEETVELDGTNSVVLTKGFRRINSAGVILSGATNMNLGTINITAPALGVVAARILPFFGHTLMAVFTVPAGKTACVIKADLTCGKGKDVSGQFCVREFGKSWQVKSFMEIFESENPFPALRGLRIPEKSDIKIDVTTQNNNTAVSASFELLLF